MIGPKKLSTIRQELRRTLSATGDDPIRWLEERMAVSEPQGAGTAGESEVLQSLRRLLEPPQREKRQRHRVATKK